MVPRYNIEVTWSADDQVWIADVPDLTFCTAHGPTPHDAVEAVEEAMAAWLDAAQATGRAIPDPSSPALRA